MFITVIDNGISKSQMWSAIPSPMELSVEYKLYILINAKKNKKPKV